jgi:uncharacterized protein
MIVEDYPAFKTNFIYRHQHLSTIIPAISRKIPIGYTRKKISTPDDDFFNVDCILRSHKRAILLVHGLEGSSQSSYIKGFAHFFAQQAYDVHAFNFRSCGGEINQQANSYHSGFTADIKLYLNQLALKYTSIYLVGFSLGGNVLLKYLANPHEVHSHVKAAAVLSVPVDLKGCAMQLDSGFNRFYMQRFLKSLIAKMIKKQQLFPDKINLKGIHKIKNFKDFDDKYTAPLHGYKNAEDYWSKCSSVFTLNTINTPTLLINAKNDPFLSPSCFPFEDVVDHPFLHALFPKYGGHAGFMLNGNTNWAEPVVHTFFED